MELARPLAGTGLDLRRLFSLLAWMNPRQPEPTIAHLADACLCALAAGVRQRLRSR